MQEIKVLIADDSSLICDLLTDLLNSDPLIKVVGVAHNGEEAVRMALELKPDLITLDINMDVMDGFEATKQIMAYYPTPILIVSSSLFASGVNKVFKAISLGALDVFDKSYLEQGKEQSIQGFIKKVKFLSKIKVIAHPLAKIEGPKKSGDRVSCEAAERKIVGIVSSIGGPFALQHILKGFPENFPCGIVIVQHISTGFVQGLVEWLRGECQIKIKVAENGERIKAGVVYVAPDNFHMQVSMDKKIQLTDEPPYDGQKPSGNYLLESAARIYGGGAMGVILTGMGADGTLGIKAIREAGGVTIAQDESTSVVFGMPKAAIEMGAVQKVLPLDKIADEIVRLL